MRSDEVCGSAAERVGRSSTDESERNLSSGQGPVDAGGIQAGGGVDTVAGHPPVAWVEDADVTLYHGDVLDVLRRLPAESVQTVVTSPPYWGLRDYGVDGQIGLETTLGEFLGRLVLAFREVRRLLRADGTCWINMGDAYASAEAAPLKPKDLVGQPWRLALALQDDGWWLRSDIVWQKPDALPESVRDRPSRDHEYLFLLAKSQHYFYDGDAIREAYAAGSESRASYARNHLCDTNGRHKPGGPTQEARQSVHDLNPLGRSKRTVWSIPKERSTVQHFAAFPQQLVEPCVLAGTSDYGACAACGAPWRRVVERDIVNTEGWGTSRKTSDGAVRDSATGCVERGDGRCGDSIVRTLGWQPTCDCGAAVRPCVVLDPFMGSGTTAFVARRLGRHAIGVELSESYLRIAADRLAQQSLLAGGAAS